MRKNPNVKNVKLNMVKGFCRIVMEDGDWFLESGIDSQTIFLNYMIDLVEIDDLIFTDQTRWELRTQDSWEVWKDTLSLLGARSVSFSGIDRSGAPS